MEDIPYDINVGNLQNSIQRFPGFGRTEVVRVGDPNVSSILIFSFFEYRGDVPDMNVSDDNLTGGRNGTKPTI